MEDVTFIIKTFIRKASLQRLLLSIYIYYPNQKIIIVDDSRRRLLQEFEIKKTGLDIIYIKTQYNIGLSAGRNLLLENVKTKYFLLLDDDFILDRSSNIKGALEKLITHDLDILGGECYDLIKDGVSKRIYYGYMEIIEDILHCTTIDSEIKTLTRCDFVLNFFIAKTNSVLQVKWYEPLKILEHLDFFWRAKNKDLRIAHYSDFYTLHFSKNKMSYNLKRKRKWSNYSNILKKQIKVNSIKLNGLETIG